MKRVFFILKIPPPVHGSTLMNKIVMQSVLLRSHFDCYYFPLSISRDVMDIGKFSFIKILKILNSYVSLVLALKKHKPDLVYFALSPYGIAFLKDFFFYVIISLFRIRIVYHLHGKGVKAQGERNLLFDRLYKILFENNEAICLSPELTQDIVPYVQHPFIVPNGIKKNECLVPPRPRNPSEPFQVVYLSNFLRSKGLLCLADALGRVKARNFDFSISFIGNEGDISVKELKKYLEDIKLSSCVNHIGPLYNEHKFEKLSKSHILVLPTVYDNEAFPLVIIEAMQCGLAVISTLQGGIPSLVDDGITGLLVKDVSSNELADKIEYLIKNPEISKKMGCAGKMKYETHYTIEVFEQNLLNVLKQILNKV